MRGDQDWVIFILFRVNIDGGALLFQPKAFYMEYYCFFFFTSKLVLIWLYILHIANEMNWPKSDYFPGKLWMFWYWLKFILEFFKLVCFIRHDGFFLNLSFHPFVPDLSLADLRRASCCHDQNSDHCNKKRSPLIIQ